MTVALNSNDPLYAEIRDLHLEALGQTLNEKCVRACGVIDGGGYGRKGVAIFSERRRLYIVMDDPRFPARFNSCQTQTQGHGDAADVRARQVRNAGRLPQRNPRRGACMRIAFGVHMSVYMHVSAVGTDKD